MKKYQFYGWEQADVPATSKTYEKIKNPKELYDILSEIWCAAGREVYFKGIEPTLFKVVDSIFASGYLTADGQGIDDTIKMIENAGFTGEIESKDC